MRPYRNNINLNRKNMPLKYGLDKIRFATDAATFEKAVDLCEKGKVTRFERGPYGCSAIVLGTHPYKVYVENQHYDQGGCECYVAQKNMLCKHMVAVAIYAVKGGKKLSPEEKMAAGGPKCSGKLGELDNEELSLVKQTVTSSMKYIKAYEGPSKVWFAYQDSLQEGCNRLAKVVSDLPVSRQTASIVVDMLLRLDKKLCQGRVDDSEGIVGAFIEDAVGVLEEYVKLDPSCAQAFAALRDWETCFDWEKRLVGLIESKDA